MLFHIFFCFICKQATAVPATAQPASGRTDKRHKQQLLTQTQKQPLFTEELFLSV